MYRREAELEDEPRVAPRVARPHHAQSCAPFELIDEGLDERCDGDVHLIGARLGQPLVFANQDRHVSLIATAHQAEQTDEPLADPLDRIVMAVDQRAQEHRAHGHVLFEQGE